MARPVLFGSSYADRIGQSVRATEAYLPPVNRVNRGNHRTPLFNAELGWVVEKGPDDQADFPDHRYWVRRVRASNDDPAGNDAMKLDEYPDEWYTHDIVPVTNQGEFLTRGHLLWLNQPVVFYAGYDRNDPAEVRFWTMTPPPQPWIWVRITGSGNGPVRPNQWKYTGERQVINTDGRFDVGTGFYERAVDEIINPAEAYNDGSGLEGNSIDVTLMQACRLYEVRGSPVVAISPTLIGYNHDFSGGKVVWSIIGYPNSMDLVQ